VVLPHRHHHTWGIVAAAAAAVLSTGAAVTITARPTDDCRDSSDCGPDCQDRSDIDRDNDLVSEADFPPVPWLVCTVVGPKMLRCS